MHNVTHGHQLGSPAKVCFPNQNHGHLKTCSRKIYGEGHFLPQYGWWFRNPVNSVGSLAHYLQGFIHPRWLAGLLPSTMTGRDKKSHAMQAGSRSTLLAGPQFSGGLRGLLFLKQGNPDFQPNLSFHVNVNLYLYNACLLDVSYWIYNDSTCAKKVILVASMSCYSI